METLQNVNTQDIIKIYSMAVKELKKRGIIRTNNVVGELGEYLAIEHYNNTPGLPKLMKAPIGTENIDALSRKGERYSIKSTSNYTTGVFYGLEEKGSLVVDVQKFEYVIVCLFNVNYELQTILEMDWKTFIEHKKWHSRMKAWNLTVTKKLKESCKIIYEKTAESIG